MRSGPSTRLKTNMAAEVDQLNESTQSLLINDVSQTNGNSEISENEETDWGFSLKEVYRLAVKFFKGKQRLNGPQTGNLVPPTNVPWH